MTRALHRLVSIVVQLSVALLAIGSVPSFLGGYISTDTTANALEQSSDISDASVSNRFVVWEDDTPGNVDVFLKGTTDNGATWGPNVNVSDSPLASIRPVLGVFGSSVYVLWEEDSNIYLRMSVDSGVSWKDTVSISNTTFLSTFPRIVASGSHVYVVWQQSGDVFLRGSDDGGITWKSIKNLSNNSGRSELPQIAVSGHVVYVVWKDNSSPGTYDIFMRRSIDDGVNWKAVKNLSNNLGGSFIGGAGERPLNQITVSGSNVYVVWADYTNGPPDIYFRRSEDNGAAWKAVKNLSNNPEGASVDPQIAVVDSKVYVVWDDSASGNYQTYFRRSTDGGATWKAVKQLNSGTSDNIIAQFSTAGNSIFVVWARYTEGIENVEVLARRSLDEGATWKTAKNLSNSAVPSTWPQVSSDATSVFVFWREDNLDNSEVYFRRSLDSGETWKAVKNLSNTPGGSGKPQIVS